LLRDFVPDGEAGKEHGDRRLDRGSNAQVTCFLAFLSRWCCLFVAQVKMVPTTLLGK
jgi:hypothetical protein